MSKLAVIIGTRPEAIKLIPVYKELLKGHAGISVDLISTGQHKEMLKQVFDLFDVQPTHELEIMEPNQSINTLLSKIIAQIGALITQEDYTGVFVQGDTTTAFGAAMSAYYLRKKVFHVEAGLRSYDLNHPFPEEANRKLISVITDLNFTPTAKATNQLLKEGYDNNSIHVVGNTVIDSLLHTLATVQSKEDTYRTIFNGAIETSRNYVLITGHRRESFGKGFENICNAISESAKKYPNLDFIYPVHLNPNVQDIVYKQLGELPNVKLIQPVPYDQMVYLMANCLFILTDSGGIQEEAPALNKAVLVMRETTERQEGVEAGCAILVGTDSDRISKHLDILIQDDSKRIEMENVSNPYGDGKASEKLVKHVLAFLNKN